MSEPNERCDEVPGEAEQEELLQFAEQVQAALPSLPPQALARVHERVQAEITQKRRRSRGKAVWRFCAAAVILLALGIGGYVLIRSGLLDRTPAPVVQNNEPRGEPVLEDRVMVAVGSTCGTPTNEKPLLRLEEYQSLFTN